MPGRPHDIMGAIGYALEVSCGGLEHKGETMWEDFFKSYLGVGVVVRYESAAEGIDTTFGPLKDYNDCLVVRDIAMDEREVVVLMKGRIPEGVTYIASPG